MKVPSFSPGCVTGLSTGCLGFFFGGWFLLLFLWLSGTGLKESVSQYYHSATYPTVQGVVVQSERIDGQKHDTCHYRYRYVVNAQPYEGTEMGVEGQDCRAFSKVPHETGATVQVYYQPDNPAQSFVGRWFPWNTLLVFAMTLGMLFGVFLTAYQMSRGQVRWK